MPSETVPPILCAHLSRKVDEALIELLNSLTAPEWDFETIVPWWKVRDVVGHLLDTVLHKLSLVRDSWNMEPPPLDTPHDVVALVNRLNHEGVTVYRRLSPRVLSDLMRLACDQSARFHESLDPFAPAAFHVSWAAEETSLNWFDTARELTERRHHQQQIRLATNRPGPVELDLYHPVLDCFLRGLPDLYRHVDRPIETSLLIEVSGECGGRWYLSKQAAGWQLLRECDGEFASTVTIPQELAWRLFTKGLDPSSARPRIRIDGDQSLGEGVPQLTAVVG